MSNKEMQQLQLIRERMIAAGIEEMEVDKLVGPLAEELQRRVCGLVWEHKDTSIPNMEGKIPALTPVTDKNIVNDIHGDNHVLIEGENLLALMAMQYTHIDENGKGMIDVIYIDPPYNTGSVSFAYNDKFEKSEWLSMMDIRLKLARSLLKDDGVIFISIDDSYQAELKMLCDDVFGSDMFVACAPRKTADIIRKTSRAELQRLHDYVLIYKRNSTVFEQEITGRREYPFADEKGKYRLKEFQNSGEAGTRSARPNLYYPIYKNSDGTLSLDAQDNTISTILPHKVGNDDGRWLWSKEKFIKEWNRIGFDEKGKIGVKQYEGDEDPNKYQMPKTWLADPQMKNSIGTKVLNDVLQQKGTFDYPKPLPLIKWIISLHPNKDAIVLDFFAGSGTTGHAVLDLNKEDGGHRKVILCTNNELGKDAKKKAKKSGYEEGSEEYEALGVCRAVTYPRMQNIFPGYPGNNLYYYRIDQDITESSIDEVMAANMASGAVFYIAMKENAHNAERHDDYYILRSDDSEIVVVTDPDMDECDVEDYIVPEAFTKPDRKVYCSIYERTLKDGIEYIPYPKEVLDVLRSAKKYIRREVE